MEECRAETVALFRKLIQRSPVHPAPADPGVR